MKYLYLLLITVVFSACNRADRVEIEGTAPGIKNGVFGIVDVLNKPLYGDNIVDGKFKINEILEYAGYYQIKVTNMLDNKKTHIPYEVYLEDGKYNIEINGNDLTKYPKIKTDSKIQNELSAYYTLADELVADIAQKVKDERAFLRSSEGKSLEGAAYLERVDKLKQLQQEQVAVEATVIEKFIEKYPKSTIAAHFIKKVDYKDDPARYYALYNKLSDEAKNTEEGKEIGPKLAGLAKLVAGQTAPDIFGTDANGKAFDRKAFAGKKIILIDFWRAGNEVSRQNHLQMNSKLFFQVNSSKEFDIISIDLDENKEYWLKAIKEDNMKWPQFSDLKGNESKNVEAWGISRVPTYYLLDGNWKILKRDIPYNDISFEITDYMEKK
ncbi:redoxin domain-containing protein [Mucilaginibacter sp. JRF]|uniref:TlpA family protein disulfide reductase n=1 Tax=Mucilaginibacter sp. JRF TaxID=2780088 RepID=UPI00187F798B|nr:thioredoxin-like domain-containing protein [Mucilaginibacter sp. JRF]MBE9584159.1 redoxin domain-containing protein [Mucilaginibacter sp. JRF]